MGTEERVNPQGSASYLSSMVHHTYGKMHSSAGGENLESSSHDVSSETDKSGKNSHLSLEEYPHLPCMQHPLPSKNHENTVMLHSVEESKKPGCGASSSVDSMVDVPATAMQKTKEVFDSALEMYVHPYELNDFEDFPPLRMDASEKKLPKAYR